VTIRRKVNDQIAVVATRLDPSSDGEFQFVCECGDLRCREVIALTLAAYAASSPGSVLGSH
jgi:hypothetical protein